jgi:hypothetical protein
MTKKVKNQINQKEVSKIQSHADKNPMSATATSEFVKRAQRALAKQTKQPKK